MGGKKEEGEMKESDLVLIASRMGIKYPGLANLGANFGANFTKEQTFRV